MSKSESRKSCHVLDFFNFRLKIMVSNKFVQGMTHSQVKPVKQSANQPKIFLEAKLTDVGYFQLL